LNNRAGVLARAKGMAMKGGGVLLLAFIAYNVALGVCLLSALTICLSSYVCTACSMRESLRVPPQGFAARRRTSLCRTRL